MTYRLEFELRGLPRMSNIPSGQSHWRAAHAESKRWQSDVCKAVGAKKPATPLARYRLVLTRLSGNQPDYDGLVRGFKSVVDGLKVAGVISDDRLDNSGAWDCRWIKCARNRGHIRVVVEEVQQTNEGEV